MLAAFLENIPDRVAFKDHESRYVAVSASLVSDFGLAAATEIIGRTDRDFFAADHAEANFAEERQIMASGQPVLNRLHRETRADGRVTWSMTSTLPVRDGAGEIIGILRISRDVTRTREMELALERVQQELVDASRAAGMAEVADGVLHNVGNVLNSLNVSASVIASGLRQSKAASLAKVAALLREHQAALGDFLTRDPKGRRIPEFIASLAGHAIAERERLLREIAGLQKGIEHIREIVAMQQAYATAAGVLEPLDPATLMEDSLRMNAGALVRHEVRVERAFQPVPALFGEKAKVLQILVNLIRNAKHACDDAGRNDKIMTLRIEHAPAAGRVRLIVQDNGVGIPPENLTRIFAHGFTTRVNGHGFGLHSAANAAQTMKGSLTAHSDGPDRGATFILELPVAPPLPPSHAT